MGFAALRPRKDTAMKTTRRRNFFATAIIGVLIFSGTSLKRLKEIESPGTPSN
jgi:hypothetical protein